MIIIHVQPCRKCEDLVRENAELREFRDRAIEHIDDLNVIIADQREKLATEKPKPGEGCIRFRIAKHQAALRIEAHQYMQKGPAGRSFQVQGTDDLIKVIKVLLTAANHSKPLQVFIQEAV